jgi:hypothetical protein
MSSARANASARNRRAGGDMPPQQMNGRPGQPMQQQIQQPQLPPKLSVSDAIALITLRLGRVEQIIQTMPVDGQNNIAADGENIRIVDNAVFESMVQRLDSLEKAYHVLATTKKTEVSAPVSQSTPSVVAAPKEVTETIEVLKAEMVQVKSLLLNLQAFTMQTNQRLSEIVFNGGDFLEINEECDGIVSGDVLETTLLDNNITIGAEQANALESPVDA